MGKDEPPKRRTTEDDHRLDLPLGPGGSGESRSEPRSRPGSPADRSRSDERASQRSRPPGELARPDVTPRHQRRRSPSPRRRRGIWLWLLLALLFVSAAAYWFLLRPPVAVADPARLEFAPSRVGQPGESAEVELLNGGVRGLQLVRVEVVGAGASDFRVRADECSGALLAGDARCVVSLDFEPSAAGERTAALEVTSNASDEPLSVPVAGRGLAPAATFAPATIDFERVAVGKASGAAAVTLTNTGSAPLAVARMAVEGSGEDGFVWVSNACSGESLEPGASCTVRIAFRPAGTGEFEAELKVWSDAAEEPRVALAGLGVAPGFFTRPAALDFGSLRPGQRTEARTVAVSNTGNAPLILEEVAVAGEAPATFELMENGCAGVTLEGEATCRLAVRYRPSAAGRHEAVLELRAEGLPRRHRIPLRGQAVAPRLALSETALDFGRVVQYGTNERSLEIGNVGSAPLELAAMEIDGAGGAFGISRRDCPESLEPGGECGVRLRFSPSRLGEARGRLTLRHDAVGSPAVVELRGTATPLPAPSVEVEPTEIRFGTLPVDERSDIYTIKVRSTGTARLTLRGYELVGDHAADFHLVPASCEGLSSLLPESDCTIGVRFRPREAGGRRARIVVRHDAAGGSSEIRLVGEGL